MEEKTGTSVTFPQTFPFHDYKKRSDAVAIFFICDFSLELFSKSTVLRLYFHFQKHCVLLLCKIFLYNIFLFNSLLAQETPKLNLDTSFQHNLAGPFLSQGFLVFIFTSYSQIKDPLLSTI